MKKLIYLIVPAILFAACGSKNGNNSEDIIELKKQRAQLDLKIKNMEAGKKDTTKVTPVSVSVMQPSIFHAYVEVQSQISGDENILATTKAPGTVKSILVKAGQKVNQGQVLALLDASIIEQQIETVMPQLNLTKSVYEKQQTLWAQNIGTELQLLTAKTQYEATQKQITALQTQRDMYRIIAPISGVIDAVNLKVGDVAQPGFNGFKVVSYNKLKAEANLGENYLGKVNQGDPVILLLPDLNDSIKTNLSYVAQAVDPSSRSFVVQVMLASNTKLHPNMACIMKIINYENAKAIVVPVSVIQKTMQGDMLSIVEDNKAKIIPVTVGKNANGMVEILSGLKAGDQVITAGYEELDNGQSIKIQ